MGNSAVNGMRHFNSLENYRFFHHWFSRVKNAVIMGERRITIFEKH
jgi:hypothetical protein